MRELNLTKKDYIVLFVILLSSALITVFLCSNIGKKDMIMFYAATVLLLIETYLILYNKKLSILLFIASFPIIVTARRVVYFDFLIFKVTYETIYITILFIKNFKDISFKIKEAYFLGNNELLYIIFVFMFALFSINSAFFSSNILRSIGYSYISIIVPIMFALCIYINFDKGNIKQIINALILQCDLSCLYGFSQIITNKIPLSQIASNRLYITFGFHNVNIFAGIVILILPFILNEILYHNNAKKEKYYYLISFIICILGLYITFTRGAWLAFFLSVMIMLISKRYKKLFYLIGLFCIAFIKPALTYILKRGTNMDISMNESSIARLQSLYTSIVMILKYPFGIGGGNFEEYYKKYMIEGYYFMPENLRSKIIVASYSLQAAHNLWLQIATEFGIICAIIFFAILINRLIIAIKNFNNLRAEVACIVSYLIFSILTGVEFEHKGIITATIIIWIVIIIIQIKKKNH